MSSIESESDRQVRENHEFEVFAAGLLIVGIIGVSIAENANSNTDYNNAVKQETQIITEKGLFNEHPVVYLSDIPGFPADNDFNVFNGDFKGKNQTLLQFGWKAEQSDENFQIIAFPLDKIVFDIKADPNISSTVSFIGDLHPRNYIGLRSIMGPFVAKNDPNLNDYAAESNSMFLTISQQNYNKVKQAANKLAMNSPR